MKKSFSKIFLPVTLILCAVTVGGAYASWSYGASSAQNQDAGIAAVVGSFQYSRTIYIASAKVIGGSYESASITKTTDTTATADVKLLDSRTSTVQMEVLFYNPYSASYYYDETDATSNNGNVGMTISGLTQKQEVPSKSYATLRLEFSYVDGGNLSNGDLLSDLTFKFNLDKEAIGGVVAETAIEKFEDILNNETTADSFEQLTTAMNNRGNFLNKGSSVTYIGNVAGADSGDSSTLVELFGSELMEMDLDGDGNPEPITMMVKREDLDGNSNTGDTYTYSNGWFGQETVEGVEMTLYITADSFDGKSQGDEMKVYAAVYTKYPNEQTWTQIVPLTQGWAPANNYTNGDRGEANSFNTDDWYTKEEATGETHIDIETLVRRYVQN